MRKTAPVAPPQGHHPHPHPPHPQGRRQPPHPPANNHYLKQLLQQSWPTIATATAFGLISGICNSKLIALVNQAVSQPAQNQPVMEFFVLVAMTLSIGVLSQFILIGLSQDAIYQLRLTLSRNILMAPLAHLEHLGDNRLLAALTDDVRVLSHTVSGLPTLCVDMATIAGCLAYLGWLSGPMFAVFVAITLVAVWSIQAIIRKAHGLFAIARQEEDHLFKHFQAITTGTKELKLNRDRRDDFLNHSLEASVGRMKQKNSHAMKIFALSDGMGQLSLFLTLGVILFVAPRYLNTSLPLLATYALTVTYLTMPFQNLLHRLPDLMRASVSLKKLDHMQLALAHEQEVPSVKSREVTPAAAIDLRNITYHYQPQDDEQGFTLGPINLSLQPGQITYLIGGNGSGKSTLAKILAGLYLPDGGELFLNGTRLTERNQEWYRQHFSAVFSDFYLFDRCLGLHRPDLDRVARHYLQQLQLDHKVQVKDGKLSTTRLSQGQRKRLALLTAYLEDRPVYLFDEWAADQEPGFRELFYTDILVRLKRQGKTVIVITHDDRYFYLADQLIKLDYGKVANKPAIAVSR